MSWKERIGAFFGRPVTVADEGATPASPTEDKLRLLRRGKGTMSREAMLAIIEELGAGDIEELASGDEDSAASRQQVKAWGEWTDAARQDWIDILLEVVAAPLPPGERPEIRDEVAGGFLELMAHKFPKPVLAKIAALLPSDNATLRPYLIRGLGALLIFEEPARRLLQPFIDGIKSLPLPELVQLADVITFDAERGRAEIIQILQRIREAIPPIEDEEHDDAREEVEGAISFVQSERDAKGESGSAST